MQNYDNDYFLYNNKQNFKRKNTQRKLLNLRGNQNK